MWDDADPATSDGVRRLSALCEAYLQEGLTAHPKKTFKGQRNPEVCGVAIDGESGYVKAKLSRLIPLMDLTARVARLGYATVGLLETLVSPSDTPQDAELAGSFVLSSTWPRA